MAKLNHISVQTLRYYDTIGLFCADEVDPKTGYRYYHVTQSVKLDFINHMKYLGLNLGKIRELFEKKDLRLIENHIDLQLENILKEKEKLEIMERGALKFKRSLEEYEVESRKNLPEIREFEERRIFIFDGKINIYESDMETYEYILRELKKQVILENLPVVYFCNVGSIIRQKNLEVKRFYSSEIFLFLDEFFALGEHVEILPKGSYATISFKGKEGFTNEIDQAKRLLAFIREKQYRIMGDYYCEVITEFPLFENKNREMFIRLQIPVAQALTL